MWCKYCGAKYVDNRFHVGTCDECSAPKEPEKHSYGTYYGKEIETIEEYVGILGENTIIGEFRLM